MKDMVHRAVHRSLHLCGEGKLHGTEVAFHATVDFGHVQNTGMGWSDPTFAHGSVAKVNRGSLQPTRSPRSAPRAKGNRYAASHPRELRASRAVRLLRSGNLRQMRNRARCGSFHTERRVWGLV